MDNINKNNFLFQEISSLKGVGKKLKHYLKNKKIEKIKDLLFDLPYEVVDRSRITEVKNLEIGKIATIKVDKKICIIKNKIVYFIITFKNFTLLIPFNQNILSSLFSSYLIIV